MLRKLFAEAEPQDERAALVAAACREGNAEALKRLLEADAPVDYVDERGWRPIHEAAAANHVDCLTLLINHGKSYLEWKTRRDCDTPLVLAVIRKHLEAVTLLLNAGANPDAGYGYVNQSILHSAVCDNSIDIVVALLDAGADIDQMTFFGVTPIFFSSFSNTEMLSLLLDRNASLGFQDDYGKTLLYMAVEKCAFSATQLIIKKLKSIGDKTVIDLGIINGETPLMAAAERGWFEGVQLLVEAGADVNVVAGSTTAIHSAAGGGHVKCLQLLYPLMSEELISTMCNKGFIACLQHHAIYVDRHSEKVLEFLYNCGEDPNTCLQPFNIINSKKTLRFRDILQIRATCLCSKNVNWQVSVLTCAMLFQPSQIVVRIIESGGDINPKSVQTMAPLYVAVVERDLEMVKLLLKHGANPNYPKSIDPKKCAFALPVAFSFPEILVELLKAGGDIRLCFNRISKPHSQFVINTTTHINCLSKIVNIFSGKQMNLLYKNVSTSWYFTILEKDDVKNDEFEDWLKASSEITHCNCKHLVADIDSMSLKHLCRLKLQQLILQVNNWKCLQQCLAKLPVNEQLIQFLLYNSL